MEPPPFCPNPSCRNHFVAPRARGFPRVGAYQTRAFGRVQRFRCPACGRTFSSQTFSIDYWAKKIVDYRGLLARHASSESVRAIGRALGLSCCSVLNRFDRLARQAIALHASLRPLARNDESVCVDGFVSFDVSQYFPSEIAISVTARSRLVLDFSHATRRRSGTTTAAQRARSAELYPRMDFERGAVSRGFREVLVSLGRERPPARWRPLVLITDEKREYVDVLHRSPLWLGQDEERRIAHIRISSRLPRTWLNPLFPSNYIDREIRKDQANHHRETTCFSRNVSNAMARLCCYLVHHNYCKRYSAKAPGEDRRVHAEVAGIARELIDRSVEVMYNRRAFISRLSLPPTLERIWRKSHTTPLKPKADYLPAYALE